MAADGALRNLTWSCELRRGRPAPDELLGVAGSGCRPQVLRAGAVGPRHIIEGRAAARTIVEGAGGSRTAPERTRRNRRYAGPACAVRAPPVVVLLTAGAP
jgi:hypothetical protein